MGTPRGELREKIVANCCEDSSGAGLTRAQIAKCVGLKKSPHLTGVINDLVNDGWLIADRRTRSNGTIEFVYRFLPEEQV